MWSPISVLGLGLSGKIHGFTFKTDAAGLIISDAKQAWMLRIIYHGISPRGWAVPNIDRYAIKNRIFESMA